MLTRRRFLGYAGASAMLAACSPSALSRHPYSSFDAPATATELQPLKNLPQRANLLLGYPVNMTTPPQEFFHWRQQLFKVGINQFAFNNVGNPEVEGAIPFNTHEMEKELIHHFASLYGFKPKEAWGFLTHSGTDSNMHGLYMGCTLLKKRSGLMPKIYFTKEAHYSIQILRDLMSIDWVEVDACPDGSMDAEALAQQLAAHRNYPALVVATVGTTFKGAIDSIDAIQSKLRGRDAFLHVDAALFGGYFPHTEFAAELFHRAASNTPGKKQPRYDSLAVSCHKFFGFPAPAGLFITAKTTFEAFHAAFSQVHDPEYLHQIPGTITCSRDAVKPAEFYFFSSESAFARQREDAHQILRRTDYLMKELKSHFARLQPMRASERSNIIYFRKPDDEIVKRYSLATVGLDMDGKQVPYAHAVVMPHANKAILDRFLHDLEQHSGK